MITGKSKVSTKGWIVIPKEIRDEMGIQPGDEMRLVYQKRAQAGTAGILKLSKVSRTHVAALKGKYKGMGGERSWTEALLDERRQEFEREERKIAGAQRKRRTSA